MRDEGRQKSNGSGDISDQFDRRAVRVVDIRWQGVEMHNCPLVSLFQIEGQYSTGSYPTRDDQVARARISSAG